MNQLFLQNPDKSLLFNLLDKICNNDENYYLISKSVFKLAVYNNLLSPFCEQLIPYYHKSKLFYINRKINYKNFLTIIRQLCNCLNINFIYFNDFDNSSYQVIYKIFKDS